MPKSSSLTTRSVPFSSTVMLLRFEIAVHDARAMRRFERAAHRLQHAERVGRGESPAQLDELAQVGPFQESMHVKRPPVGELAELEDVDDVRWRIMLTAIASRKKRVTIGNRHGRLLAAQDFHRRRVA